MIQVIDLSEICRICALKVTQFAFDRYCLDCWEAMSNGR